MTVLEGEGILRRRIPELEKISKISSRGVAGFTPVNAVRWSVYMVNICGLAGSERLGEMHS